MSTVTQRVNHARGETHSEKGEVAYGIYRRPEAVNRTNRGYLKTIRVIIVIEYLLNCH